MVRTEERDDRAVGANISLVRGDGTIGWSQDLALVPDAPAGGVVVLSGPRDGRLAFSSTDGDGTEVHVGDVRDGSTVTVASLNDTVLAGVLAPSGSAIYLLLDGSDPGVHRLALTGNAAFEKIADLPPLEASALASPWSLLRITPDARYLLIEICTDLGACRWQIIDLDSSEERELTPDGAGPLVDVSSDVLLARAAECATGPCPFMIVDLGSGEAREWDPGAHNARLAETDDGDSVLVYDTQGIGGQPRIAVVDPGSLEERALPAAADEWGTLGLARQGQDEWAPPGWIVLAPQGLNLGEQSGPVLMRITDGETIQLPLP